MSSNLKESQMEQIVLDSSGLSTSCPEYVFLYEIYKGKWYRHIDASYPFFSQAWAIISVSDATETKISNTSPTIEQIYDISGMTYHCLWTNVQKDIKSINGPPDVISWNVEMIPPSHIQQTLF